MDYLDNGKLKKMKDLNAKSATFVVYNYKIGGVRDKIDVDTHIIPIVSIKEIFS